jgi:hypothetical protein
MMSQSFFVKPEKNRKYQPSRHPRGRMDREDHIAQWKRRNMVICGSLSGASLIS